MDSFRPQKSPGSDRFLGLFSSSPPDSTSSSFELHEDDIFSTDTEPNPKPIPIPFTSTPNLNLNPNPNPKSSLSPFHRERNFGILAALHEENKNRNPKFFQRKPSISSSTSLASTSPSSSSTRMIPTIPKLKAEYIGKIHHQSAPVNVPVVPGRGAPPKEEIVKEMGEGEEEDEMMLPPHEIVDRAQGKGEPMTTFSVLEGIGRTLKGRDLRRVRNAVWRKTGNSSNNFHGLVLVLNVFGSVHNPRHEGHQTSIGFRYGLLCGFHCWAGYHTESHWKVRQSFSRRVLEVTILANNDQALGGVKELQLRDEAGTVTATRNKRLRGRKMGVDDVAKKEAGSEANTGANPSSVGKCGHGEKGELSLKCELMSSRGLPFRFTLVGLVPFSSDYHTPKGHPPKNN